MTLVPRNNNLGVSLFDNMFDDFFKDPFFTRNNSVKVMKTDIQEKDNNYETYKYDIIPVNITKGFIETKEKNEDKRVVGLEKYSDSLYEELSKTILWIIYKRFER